MAARTLGDDVYDIMLHGASKLHPADGRILNGFKRLVSKRSFESGRATPDVVGRRLIASYASLFEGGAPERFTEILEAVRPTPSEVDWAIEQWNRGYPERIGFNPARDGSFTSTVRAYLDAPVAAGSDVYTTMQHGLARFTQVPGSSKQWFEKRVGDRSFSAPYATQRSLERHVAIGYAVLSAANATDRFEAFLDEILGDERPVTDLHETLSSEDARSIGLEPSELPALFERVERYARSHAGTLEPASNAPEEPERPTGGTDTYALLDRTIPALPLEGNTRAGIIRALSRRRLHQYGPHTEDGAHLLSVVVTALEPTLGERAFGAAMDVVKPGAEALALYQRGAERRRVRREERRRLANLGPIEGTYPAQALTGQETHPTLRVVFERSTRNRPASTRLIGTMIDWYFFGGYRAGRVDRFSKPLFKRTKVAQDIAESTNQPLDVVRRDLERLTNGTYTHGLLTHALSRTGISAAHPLVVAAERYV